jgi:hypothetical protein
MIIAPEKRPMFEGIPVLLNLATQYMIALRHLMAMKVKVTFS